jgi:menaquinone-9 beta-reductase
MNNSYDVVIVGGGPAGLACALSFKDRPWRILLVEKRDWPIDKTCGEGIMPSGLRILHNLGVHPNGAPFHGIAYSTSDGAKRAEANFAEGPALAVRRLDLSNALWDACRHQQNLELRPNCEARWLKSDKTGVHLQVGEQIVQCKLLIGADGLHSPMRNQLGLSKPGRVYWRWGIRQHFAVKAWSEKVEVMLGDGCEAYVTPIDRGTDSQHQPRHQIGVALLCYRDLCKPDFPTMLSRFPELEIRLRHAVPTSKQRALGPLGQSTRAAWAPGAVLLGDASGYIDASTGEGISLALQQVEHLASILPNQLPARVDLGAFYGLTRARMNIAYILTTYTTIILGRFPRLRREVVGILARFPRLFQALLSFNMGTLSLQSVLRPQVAATTSPRVSQSQQVELETRIKAIR